MALLDDQVEALSAELRTVRAKLDDLERSAQELGERAYATQRAGRSDEASAPIRATRDAVVGDLTALRREADERRTTLRDIHAEIARLKAGDMGDPRRHLRFIAHPQDPSEVRRSRLLEVWAAISAGALLVLVALLILLGSDTWRVGVPALIFAYVAIEAIVRGRFLGLLLNITVLLAVFGLLILLREYFVQAVVIGVAAIGVLVVRDNLRGLRASLR